MPVPPLPTIMIEPLVRAALLEDLGRAGDITTDAIVPAEARAATALVARQPGVVAGLDLALLAFRLVDPAIETTVERGDGSRVAPGDVIATVAGPARGILTAERARPRRHRPSRQDRSGSRQSGPARGGARHRCRRRAARQYEPGDAAPRCGDGRPPRDHRSLRPHHAANRAGHRGERRRSHPRRLADPQRARARYRARLSRVASLTASLARSPSPR